MHARDPLLDDVLATARRAGGCYLGTVNGSRVYSGPGRSTMVLGPSRSGKTTSIIIPNILGHPGPVVATSTKDELVAAVAPSRGRRGTVAVFDPSGTVRCAPGIERIGWSPLDGATQWENAIITAAAMVEASTPASGLSQSHWTERSATLLSSLLHAAATEECAMADLVRWVDRHDPADALTILERANDASSFAHDALVGIVATADREQSSIWSTTSGALTAYRSSAALASCEGPRLDAASFVHSADTVVLCATSRLQRFYAPLLVGALGTVRDATYLANSEGTLPQPVLFALDEVANIAPLPDLPSLVSEGGGQGLVVLAGLQDLTQARQRWGTAGEGFLSLFPTAVILQGIADRRTLELLSALSGEQRSEERSISRRAFGTARSVHVGGRWHPTRSVAELAQGRAGHALVLGPTRDLTEVELTPSHRDLPWLALRSPSSRALEPRSR